MRGEGAGASCVSCESTYSEGFSMNFLRQPAEQKKCSFPPWRARCGECSVTDIPHTGSTKPPWNGCACRAWSLFTEEPYSRAEGWGERVLADCEVWV